MEYEYFNRKKFFCSNCGKTGHEFRMCREPISSWGIINIDIIDDINESIILKEKFGSKKNTQYQIISNKYPNIKCYMSDNIRLHEDQSGIYKLNNESICYQSNEDIKKFCYYKDKIMFMLVSRRFSLGFIEFLRGKYDATNVKSIINLFEQMYEEEIKFIHNNQYDDILYHFINRNNEPKNIVLNKIYEGKYSNEYCDAKIKFDMLLNPQKYEDIPLDLYFYTQHIKPKWKNPEWGFPKGRRDKRTEENITCACREFEEETGYKSNDYMILNRIEPIEERLIGTNGVHYRHIYYLSINNCDRNRIIEEYDAYEIGEIKWFTYEEAIKHIRPYHVEKKNILTRIYLFIMNYLIHNGHDI